MFGVLLVILVIASAIAIYYSIYEEKLYNKRESEFKTRIGWLEQEMAKKYKETEELSSRLKNDFNDKEKKLNIQILELKEQLFQTQDTLKNENTNKLNLEKKLSELQAQLAKLNKDLSSHKEMYKGLKSQYDELERDMEKLQKGLTNKDTVLKTEQSEHQQLKDKYENLLKQTYASGPENKEKTNTQVEAE